MALSQQTLVTLRESLDALDKFYARRIAEVDSDVANLRSYGSTLSVVGEKTTSAAAKEALAIVNGILG